MAWGRLSLESIYYFPKYEANPSVSLKLKAGCLFLIICIKRERMWQSLVTQSDQEEKGKGSYVYGSKDAFSSFYSSVINIQKD